MATFQGSRGADQDIDKKARAVIDGLRFNALEKIVRKGNAEQLNDVLNGMITNAGDTHPFNPDFAIDLPLLHLAVSLQRADMVGVILSYPQFDINQRAAKSDGMTPLHVAVINDALKDSVEMTVLLIKHGADPEVPCDTGENAAAFAARLANNEPRVERLAKVLALAVVDQNDRKNAHVKKEAAQETVDNLTRTTKQQGKRYKL